MKDLKYTLDILELITKCITIVGVPVAILTYFYNRRKDRQQRESSAYDELDDKYSDFLKLCLEYSDLKISSCDPAITFTSDQLEQRELLFEILISLFERAYLQYKRLSKKIKKKQFEGWDEYMRSWLDNINFRTYWDKAKSQYDLDFQAYIQSLTFKPNPSAPNTK